MKRLLLLAMLALAPLAPISTRAAEEQDAALVVSSVVSGNFPGSPATLRYRFTLAGDRILSVAVG